MPSERACAPRSRRFEIEGVDLGYPTRFRDGASAAALFVVDARVAQRLIHETGFEVAEVAPGRALLAFTCVHYTDTDCGVYEETAQAFFVRRTDRRDGFPARIPGVGRYLTTLHDVLAGEIASHTWRLQVTTRLSQQCGLQMWGFPKEMGEIGFTRAEGRVESTLALDGRDVFRFSAPAEGTRTPAPITSAVYSIHEGAPHVSGLTQRYRETGYAVRGAELELGDHPLAGDLRSLGLPKRPLLTTWNGHLDFEMSSPEKL
ncbi:MAG: acetoacetate decarboxylase family protein [Deltaproteobacteria bacterium]|nr:acetoacetate decarboxylase family protein [Deltaproteobacteria bacterium]MBW2446207.1 acetoacetate decarboxylase family protein [Deltaproteobacteria bacterium]